MNSINNFKSFLDVIDFFENEETCTKYLEDKRWSNGISCLNCGNFKIYRTNRGFRCSDRKCDYKFSVKIGTIMEHSPLKLRLWFASIYLISANKKGISSYQLARHLGISQLSAWFVTHRIRKILTNNTAGKLTGIVSSDETFIGGKNKNRHRDKKVPKSQGRSFKDKTPVIGLFERKGQIRTFVMPNTEAKTIQPILEANISPGSILMTDEWKGYSRAHEKFEHRFVNHRCKQYVDGDVHVNDVENFWSHVKRTIIGTHHWVSRKHLHRYCAEMTYRFNTIGKTDWERFDEVMSNVEGRLTWRDLTRQVTIIRQLKLPFPEKREIQREREFRSMSEYRKYRREIA